MAARAKKKAGGRRAGGRRVQLKPQDSFDLIRLLATSQSDPRKAVAELVQNSLDAGAGRVTVTWFTERGRRALRILDDGRGVFPELDRETALRRIAQTIGHSHKRDLDPVKRRELMMLGQYGIGLLGFWSLGEEMEVRSRVDGGKPACLCLLRDVRHGEIAPARARRLDELATFTEITIRNLHSTAMRQVRPGRLHPYLSRELRGQLLGRDVEVMIYDRVARGLARKEWRVVAQPYLGKRIANLTSLHVPGHADASLELYYVSPDEERAGVVELGCGGATVLENLAGLDAAADGPGGGALRHPWSTGCFEGVVDFPQLHVAPGTRRGVVADAAYEAFLGALPALEARLAALIADEDARREEQRRERVAVEIRRAFRSVARSLPEYDMFDVGAVAPAKPEGESAAESIAETGAPVRDAAPEPATDALLDGTDADGDGPVLFPPGPLADVRIRPARPRVVPGGTRPLTAVAVDADGRTLPPDAGVGFEWSLKGAGAIEPEGRRVRYAAPDHVGSVQLGVRAVQGEAACEAFARIDVTDAVPGRHDSVGIPEPRAVNAPGERWRSRMAGDTWEYNEGHRDYRAVADVSAQRVRYLSHLFAKELVLRNFGRPADAEILERMVEVITYLHARGS